MKPKQVISSLLTSAALGQPFNPAAIAAMVPPSNNNHASVAILVANNPPSSNQQLRIFAKTGDTIDNIPNVKVGSWGGNLIDDNGSIAYLGFYNGYYGGVFRDNKLVLGKEQIIEGYKVSEIKGFFLFKNGHLDICAELYNPKTLQTKYIVTRNGEKIFDSDTIDDHVVSLSFLPGEEKGKDFYLLIVKDSHYKDHSLETDGSGNFLASDPNRPSHQKIINYAMAPNDPMLKAINEQFPELGVSSGRRDVSGFQKSASGAEAIILDHGLGGKPEDGRVIIKAGGREQQISQSKPQKIYDIFVGGLGDTTFGHAVEEAEKDFEAYVQKLGKQDNITAKYFTWKPKQDIIDYINTLPANAIINIIGHSYGGDTVADISAHTNRKFNKVILVDPVAAHLDEPLTSQETQKPQYPIGMSQKEIQARETTRLWQLRVKKRVALDTQNAAQVIDIDPVLNPGQSSTLSDGDKYAEDGGKWDELPSIPNVEFRKVAGVHHAAFGEMVGQPNYITQNTPKFNQKTVFEMLAGTSSGNSRER